jgi:hypothetical protein
MMQSYQRRLLLILAITLAICGGALVYFMMDYLIQVTRPDTLSSEATRFEIGMLLLVVTMLAGMPAVGAGAYVMYVGSRIRATGQWPPAGMGFRAESRVLLGKRATPVGVLVMSVGFMLVVTGLLLPFIGWQLF